MVLNGQQSEIAASCLLPPGWRDVILLCSALSSVDIPYPSPLVLRTESELTHRMCCQPCSMKVGREESPSILNLMAERRRERARSVLYILFLLSPNLCL